MFQIPSLTLNTSHMRSSGVDVVLNERNCVVYLCLDRDERTTTYYLAVEYEVQPNVFCEFETIETEALLSTDALFRDDLCERFVFVLEFNDLMASWGGELTGDMLSMLGLMLERHLARKRRRPGYSQPPTTR